eukprot:1157391-Pelagomonas_calceolata.AAC.2
MIIFLHPGIVAHVGYGVDVFVEGHDAYGRNREEKHWHTHLPDSTPEEAGTRTAASPAVDYASILVTCWNQLLFLEGNVFGSEGKHGFLMRLPKTPWQGHCAHHSVLYCITCCMGGYNSYLKSNSLEY